MDEVVEMICPECEETTTISLGRFENMGPHEQQCTNCMASMVPLEGFYAEEKEADA